MLEIEVGFDFICPWCLIGLRQLQRALQQLRAAQPEVTVSLRWRGVQLLPQAPAAGWPFHEFYLRRLGGEAALRQRQAVVQRAAAAAGVQINYDAIAVMPNTADAHWLLAHAVRHGDAALCEALLERLLRAYFERGDDLGDRAVLLAHGEAVGLERVAMQAELCGTDQPYHAGGVGNGSSGVPFYTFNGKLSVTGAQPPEVLLAAMREALAAAPLPL